MKMQEEEKSGVLPVHRDSQSSGIKSNEMMIFYQDTGLAKLPFVANYVEDLLDSNQKFLLFAHHTRVMDGLEDLLRTKRAGYIRLDGSTAQTQRQNLVDTFQNDETCRVALLSIKAAGVGLTLTRASLVVFAELYWTPAQLLQCEDRAYR
jgi:SWI/SNF-related matrix-associated actin-dependent regulator 1 of chromatin subfamily A